MAEGFLKFFDPELEVYSAGTKPEVKVNPNAIEVMKELGIDISSHYPKNVNGFVNLPFNYVITVCDKAKEVCPVFTGDVKHRLHLGFDDPVEAKGTGEKVLSVYRRVRDEIKAEFTKLYKSFD